jgi:spore germination protein
MNLDKTGNMDNMNIVSPIAEAKETKYEVFGFAPYWKINDLDNVDFNTLTTFAYFGVPIHPDGNLDTSDYGYEVFQSNTATKLFKKAHEHNTKVVLTITLMNNFYIETFLSDEKAKKRTINQTVKLVTERGIDGINVDIEYDGDPGQEKRDEFSKFVKDITDKMHEENPNSKVTVSVYASAAKYPKLYDIAKISDNSDGIFMMAYDFATTGSEVAMPTAPFKGHKEGKYWYDIETAVEDFLKVMPSEKLILGVPYYGYNYSVETPEVKASTMAAYYWNANAVSQEYKDIEEINEDMEGVSEYKSGWDNAGQVSWKAYYRPELGIWRMVFNEDKKSLAIKYDFAISKNLGGVGIWALGFDHGKPELWQLLSEKFGDINKLAKKYACLI